MKKLSMLLFSLVIASGVAMKSNAQEVEAVNEKIDELELSHEVEDLEQYGDDAAAKQDKEESARLKGETRQLEMQITTLQKKNDRSKQRLNEIAALYKQKEALAVKIKSKAFLSEQENQRLQAKNDRLKAKVESAEQKVISQVERRKAAEQSLAEGKREKRSLERRLKLAEVKIERNKKRAREIRAQATRLAQKNAKLRSRVARAENRSVIR